MKFVQIVEVSLAVSVERHSYCAGSLHTEDILNPNTILSLWQINKKSTWLDINFIFSVTVGTSTPYFCSLLTGTMG